MNEKTSTLGYQDGAHTHTHTCTHARAENKRDSPRFQSAGCSLESRTNNKQEDRTTLLSPHLSHVSQCADAPISAATAGVVVPRRDGLDELCGREGLEEAFFDRVLVAVVLLN